MRMTECLNMEHGVFLSQLGVLEGMWMEGSPPAELRAVALAIGRAVENHRENEERLLYPAILREFGEGFPPMAVMEAEHRQIERCLQALDSREGDIRDWVRSFVDTLRGHIHKEMHVLFPLAEQRIPAADLERMAHECSEHRPTAAA